MQVRTVGGLAICVLLLWNAPVRADVDAQCVEDWAEAVSAEVIGDLCKWIDEESRGKLRAIEDRALACAAAAATDAEKEDLNGRVVAARERLSAILAEVPCDDPEARQYFDSQVAK
jgi:hypothetical protein